MNDAIIERIAKIVCASPWSTASKNTKNNAAITAKAAIREATKDLSRAVDAVIETIDGGGRVPAGLWDDLRKARMAVE